MGMRLTDRLDARAARVSVLGQGYVGLTLAIRANEAGFAVTGFEPDPARLASLLAGRSFVDDVDDEMLAYALEHGYRPTGDEADLAGFDVAVIAVPTPLLEGRPDLRAIELAAESVGRQLRRDALVVLESTTYPGTTVELLVPALEAASGLRAGIDFSVGYSPERIDPGNPTHTLTTTPKIVSGIDARSLHAIEMFYGAFVDKLVPVGRPEEAELAKLLENTFRHVNIALVNELAVFSHDLGVDLWAAIDAAATKPFGFMPFRPGPGVGGHCLPVDPSYLSWRVQRQTGEPFRFVELANEVNARMPDYVVRRIQEQLNEDGLAVRGARILLLGLAYKPGTGDLREAPSAPIVAGLRRLGAGVAAVDPHVLQEGVVGGVEMLPLNKAVLGAADLVVIVTDHPSFDLDLVRREARRIFDARNAIGRVDDPGVERL